tara:strand:+ start:278 stop:1303 length:1026 start_codon:yes stop_codon:yes gene_type:complete
MVSTRSSSKKNRSGNARVYHVSLSNFSVKKKGKTTQKIPDTPLADRKRGVKLDDLYSVVKVLYLDEECTEEVDVKEEENATKQQTNLRNTWASTVQQPVEGVNSEPVKIKPEPKATKNIVVKSEPVKIKPEPKATKDIVVKSEQLPGKSKSDDSVKKLTTESKYDPFSLKLKATSVKTANYNDIGIDPMYHLKAIRVILAKRPYSGTQSENVYTLREANAKYASILIHLRYVLRFSVSYTGAYDSKTKDIEHFSNLVKSLCKPLPYNGATGELGQEMVELSYSRNREAMKFIDDIENVLKQPYSVNIDFDEASRQWQKNKIKLSDGCYKYKKHKVNKKMAK